MSNLALTKLTDDLDIIQALADLPNTTDGLTAQQLKAKFDEAVNLVKTYVNNTLTAELDTDFATKADLAASELGDISDNTLTEAKMATEMKKDVATGVASYQRALNIQRTITMKGSV